MSFDYSRLNPELVKDLCELLLKPSWTEEERKRLASMLMAIEVVRKNRTNCE